MTKKKERANCHEFGGLWNQVSEKIAFLGKYDWQKYNVQTKKQWQRILKIYTLFSMNIYNCTNAFLKHVKIGQKFSFQNDKMTAIRKYKQKEKANN